ncbi:hypothetical protein N9A94_08835 [Akkermansiaceae bacterium]|nr:hypothetical protein [Akkermansiaceae bacterium]MDB4537468.1 hypothetical protein [Akkermansiaceae bacterium]
MTDSSGDDYVSIVELSDDRALPFRVTGIVGGGEGFVKLDLFLQFGPMDMKVEEFNLATKTWVPVGIGTSIEAVPTEGTITLGSGAQALFAPRAGQTRGIFRVVCIE